MYFPSSILAIVPLALGSALPQATTPGASSAVNTTTCNGKTYVYENLAGYGFVPSNATDKFGDTIGGHGSSIAVDGRSWTRVGNSYTGILYTLPDRGWNTNVSIKNSVLNMLSDA